jgi:hypothetical protein
MLQTTGLQLVASGIIEECRGSEPCPYQRIMFHGDGFKDVYQPGPVPVVYVITLFQLQPSRS